MNHCSNCGIAVGPHQGTQGNAALCAACRAATQAQTDLRRARRAQEKLATMKDPYASMRARLTPNINLESKS